MHPAGRGWWRACWWSGFERGKKKKEEQKRFIFFARWPSPSERKETRFQTAIARSPAARAYMTMLSIEMNAIGRCGAPRKSAAALFDRRCRRTLIVEAAADDPNSNSTNRGFRILERAGGLLPQSLLVGTTRKAWRAAWKTMVVELAPQEKGTGAYSRPKAAFTGQPLTPFEEGRYRVYLGNACPWCHRVSLALAVRGLAPAVAPIPGRAAAAATAGENSSTNKRSWPVAVTAAADDPERASRGGWVFDSTEPDPVFGAPDLARVYALANGGSYSGRCTAPLLLDSKTKKIVSNDSDGILRSLDALDLSPSSSSSSPASLASRVLLRPTQLASEIDSLNEKIYANLSNGVYRCGFATEQRAYDAAAKGVAGMLDELEARLSEKRFLLGNRFTDADLRLFPVVSRFDSVYVPLFRAAAEPLALRWPSVHAWCCDVARLDSSQGEGDGPFSSSSSSSRLGDTIDVAAAKRSYFTSLFPLNPSGIVPIGGGGGEDRGGKASWQAGAAAEALACARGSASVEEVFWLR